MATVHSRDTYRTTKAISEKFSPRQREIFYAQQDAESQGLIDFIRRLIRKLRGKPAPPVPDAKASHARNAALSENVFLYPSGIA